MCFVCNKAGHTANHCPNNKTSLVNEDMEPVTQCPFRENENNLATLTQHTTIDNSPNSLMDIDLTPVSKKRPLSSVTNSNPIELSTPNTSCLDTDESDDDKTKTEQQYIDSNGNKNHLKIKKKVKRSKSNDKLAKTIDELLAPAKQEIENNPNSYLINYTQFKSFLENAFGSANPGEIAIEYTDNINDLVTMMRNIYPFLVERSIKNRFSRIINKL